MNLDQGGNSLDSQLLRKIKSKQAIVTVIGLGYVGLPLALRCLTCGFKVIGFDTDQNKIEKMKAGQSPIQDISDYQLQEVLKQNHFSLTTNGGDLKNADIFLVCVPTPLKENYEPDISFVKAAADIIFDCCKEDCFVALESSTYPGTTKQVFGNFNEYKKIFLAYSPERVDPGNEIYEVKNTPKVVGTDDPESYKIAKAFYQSIVDKVHIVTSTEVAEMSKLLENSFRSINIAFMNEMAEICEHLKIDIWNTIEAAATKPFGFMKFTPGVGVGGHCIPLDPMYLEWAAQQAGHSSEFLNLAHRVNKGQPQRIVNNVLEILTQVDKPIKTSRIVVYGMGYKGNSSDIRESKSLEIFNLLYLLGAKVDYIDENVKSIIACDGHSYEGITIQEVTSDCDLLIITNDCNQCDYQAIQSVDVLIYDVINLLKSKRKNVVIYGKKDSYQNCQNFQKESLSI
ncbi:hypothetical protein BCR26_04175 [Enterococcus rivorum]|uniref:UDP-glucose/GDP-mannose dehydrogenase C-terminal domain-containing protein n=1 Tax=Enterococcus rivorum TaxID=762845 RepID=A0A1E5KUB0_9ENTE|nr:hypothetical protein BCR26_04175 [Enterococcus rivorum]